MVSFFGREGLGFRVERVFADLGSRMLEVGA